MSHDKPGGSLSSAMKCSPHFYPEEPDGKDDAHQDHHDPEYDLDNISYAYESLGQAGRE